MEVSIRSAEPYDKDSIAEIYNHAIADRNCTFDAFPVTGARFDSFFQGGNRQALLVATINTKVIGWTSIIPISDRWAFRFTCLGSFFVHRDFRGRNVGTRLKAAQILAAKRLGYHSLIVEVLSTNIISLALNLAYGFTIVGEMPEVGFRDGGWIGLIRMQKMLGEDTVVEHRICFTVITEDIRSSIKLYRDALGLDMLAPANELLLFPLGSCEFRVCHKAAAKDFSEFEFHAAQDYTRGLYISLRYDSEQQMVESSHAALEAGANLIGQSSSRSLSLEDFNGVCWVLTHFGI